MTARKYEPLTEDDIAALKAFRKAEGRKWKETLSFTYWYNARLWRDPTGSMPNAGSILHGLRNSHGPSWLVDLKLPKDDAP